ISEQNGPEFLEKEKEDQKTKTNLRKLELKREITKPWRGCSNKNTQKITSEVFGFLDLLDRVAIIKIKTTPCNLNIVVAHLPTSENSEDETESDHNLLLARIKLRLEATLRKKPAHKKPQLRSLKNSSVRANVEKEVNEIMRNIQVYPQDT
ncbi:hypothetical protein ILUMI_16890, partial [Ignelater luminosus]